MEIVILRLKIKSNLIKTSRAEIYDFEYGNRFLTSIVFFLLLLIFGCGSRKEAPKILVFSKTAEFRHESIEAGQLAIIKLGEQKGFTVDISENAKDFTDDNLKRYSAVVFLSTTGDVLNTNQEIAMERYIQAGGGFVGVHASADTEYDWKWYGKLNGAYFKNHPHVQEAELLIHHDRKFPLLDSFPNPYLRTDEWYNFREAPEHVNVLLSLDERTYKGGENGENHPIVWYHEFDGGRAFYNGLGHTSESFEDALFIDLMWAGIEYAIGDNKKLNYNLSKSEYPPDNNRFSKVELFRGELEEPTELTILPDLSVLIAERKGGLKFYNPSEVTLTQIGKFDVYHHSDIPGVNVEMGFMGIQADPGYSKNHWVYVYYSPIEKSVDRLSRFKFSEGVWDMDSEQIILEVGTDREICCHTGGSIAFDKDGLLYLSTGDNSTPFDEIDPATGKKYAKNLYGFAPLDDRDGFYNFDARRGPGNTNDLRGKILRIKVNEDGSYEVPDGNLFEKDNPEARPEIYVMGNRNPYRISIDQKNGYLYWGEVGPDARADSLDTRGPKGYDEFNQAREAGNFGWPYFIGDNFAYWEYDFETGESLFPYDPEKPVNNSRHNTGMRELPPAQPAFIYYPYDVSPVFPNLGSGGRTAMAGPVYYGEFYPKENRLPKYFEGKLFIYEWMRNWIKLVDMDESGDLRRIDPFMPDEEFNNISDMEFGPDGRIYMVEYGSGWFTKNENSSLSIIEFNSGNRDPDAVLALERKTGSLPFTIRLDASSSSDPDGDVLGYAWYVNDELIEETKSAEFSYILEEPGIYPVFVEVSDGKGGKTRSIVSNVVAGNNQPEVTIKIDGNEKYYFDYNPIDYEVVVNDVEDGSTKNGEIDLSKIKVMIDYLEGYDLSAVDFGHQEYLDPGVEVQSIINGNDCASCHKTEGKSIGPSYMEVAEKYRNDESAEEYLIEKIRDGGSGVWGETAMSAHPDINIADVRKIVRWIQTLGEEDTKSETIHAYKGRIIPAEKFKLSDDGMIRISASYTDGGGSEVVPLTNHHTVILQRPEISLSESKEVKGGSQVSFGGRDLIMVQESETYINLGEIDFSGVRQVMLQASVRGENKIGSRTITLHAGDPAGTILASGNTTAQEASQGRIQVILPLRDKLGRTEDVWLKIESLEDSNPLAIFGLSLQ